MPRNDLKAYTSVIARLPQDLADQVKQYASQHRCSVSELVRDGLELRLDAEVPGRSTGSSSDPGGEVVHEVVQAINALVPMLRAQIQDTVRDTITEVVHEVVPRSVSTQPHNHKGTTLVIPSEIPVSAPTRKGITKGVHAGVQEQQSIVKVIHKVLPHETAEAPVSQYGAGFDTTRFFVGALCPQRHRYQDTAGSLRYVKGDHPCVTCRSLRSQKYNTTKAARRQDAP